MLFDRLPAAINDRPETVKLGFDANKNPPQSGRRVRSSPEAAARKPAAYLCQVRFWWRWDFKRLRRLCLFIFSRRFFFRLPIGFRCLREPHRAALFSLCKAEIRQTMAP